MSAPTATEIRDFLEGYNITTSILSDTWINSRRDNFVIPFIERITGLSFEGEQEQVEYLSGNNTDTLMLSNKGINEIVKVEYLQGGDVNSEISLGGLTLIEGGILKLVSNLSEGGTSSKFKKGKRNIKVTYKLGLSDYPSNVKEAIIYLCAEQILGFVGARTGGGSLTVVGFSRNYGSRGKYQDIRNDLKRDAMTLLNNYITHVVGNI